jgi:thiamine pyrophosphokinase
MEKVENISLSGFEYPLPDKSIGPAFIGVSNKIVSDKAIIKFEKGRLIVYQLTDESKK